MTKTRCFDSSGAEIAERYALDRNGLLRDGYSLRVPMRFRDADDPRTGFGSSGPRGSKEGSPCTRNGYPGVLRRDGDGELIAISDARPTASVRSSPTAPAIRSD